MNPQLMPDPYLISLALKERYHDFSHHNRKNPLEELLFIICSLQTDEKKYRPIFEALRREFPKFEMLAGADISEIARLLAPGGLSNQKAAAIKKNMATIIARFGKATLDPLKKMPEPECERFLVSLFGVGYKTARCVMMYSLGKQVFPVDTHCWRVTQRLSWNLDLRGYGSCHQKEMDILQEKIPKDLRYSLHVNMVSLGREICTPRNPRCTECPLNLYCPKIGVVRRQIQL
jgi:endonuclease III